MTKKLTKKEQQILLEIARKTLESKVMGRELPEIDLESLPGVLREPGASFVTLTKKGALRGCIGALKATKPLVMDVQDHAIAAAFHDYRFPNVELVELPDIRIEISWLTPPESLEYNTPQELLNKIQPGKDGVIIEDGVRRATFLPQVWEQLPDTERFLSRLCVKMNASPTAWKEKKLKVSTYRVQKFHE